MRFAIEDQDAPERARQPVIELHHEWHTNITRCLTSKVWYECVDATLLNHLPANFGHTSLPTSSLVAN